MGNLTPEERLPESRYAHSFQATSSCQKRSGKSSSDLAAQPSKVVWTDEEHGLLPMGLERLVKESLEFTTIGGQPYFHFLGHVGELVLSKSRRNQRSYSVQWSVHLPNPPTQRLETLLLIGRTRDRHESVTFLGKPT